MGIIYSLELINPEILEYITSTFHNNRMNIKSIVWLKNLYI